MNKPGLHSGLCILMLLSACLLVLSEPAHAQDICHPVDIRMVEQFKEIFPFASITFLFVGGYFLLLGVQKHKKNPLGCEKEVFFDKWFCLTYGLVVMLLLLVMIMLWFGIGNL